MAISNFIPTVWSESLLHSLQRKYIGVANSNRDYEGDIKEMGSVVKVCGVGSISISNYTKNSNMLSPETLTDMSRELRIDQAKCFNFQIDDVDQAQAVPGLMELAMSNAASALANTADQYVYSLYTSAGRTVVNENMSAENVLDTLLEARTLLYKQNATDPDDIVFELSPEVGALVLKAKILNATDNDEALNNGCIGTVGGVRVCISNNIYSSDEEDGQHFYCLARTRRAIAFAEQLSEVDAYRPELRFADAVKGLHLYGAKVFYPQELILMDFVKPEEEEED